MLNKVKLGNSNNMQLLTAFSVLANWSQPKWKSHMNLNDNALGS